MERSKITEKDEKIPRHYSIEALLNPLVDGCRMMVACGFMSEAQYNSATIGVIQERTKITEFCVSNMVEPTACDASYSSPNINVKFTIDDDDDNDLGYTILAAKFRAEAE